jgi:hypothetical protein
MARISTAMIAKVTMVRRSLPGDMAADCASPRCMSRTLTTCQSCSSPALNRASPAFSSGMLRFSQAGSAFSIAPGSAPGRSFR